MAVTPRCLANSGGPTLGLTSAPVLEKDGLFFQNLSHTGQQLSTHMETVEEHCEDSPAPAKRAIFTNLASA